MKNVGKEKKKKNWTARTTASSLQKHK